MYGRRFDGRCVAQWVVIALAILLGPAQLRAQSQAPAVPRTAVHRLFWKITSPTTEIYCLGSIHVATEDMYPLPPEMEAAFNRSDSLVVEADVTKVNQLELAMKILKEGSYPQGDALDKHITPETLKALQKFCTDNELPYVIFNPMKPALAAVMVEAMVVQKMGMSPELGLDMHFLREAGDTKKKIVELESADAQINLILGFDDKLGEKWLAESLKDSGKEELEKVMSAWKRGDARTIQTMVIDEGKSDPALQKINDMVIYQRNDDMVKKIDELLKGREKAFVVVGAAHLLGDRGILKQLEAKKYKVEQPQLTAPPPAMPTTRR